MTPGNRARRPSRPLPHLGSVTRAASRVALSLLGLSVGAPVAHAQEADQRPTPLPALGRSLASNSDTTSIIQNPAGLAGLPGTEFRYSGYFVGDSARVPTQGHAFAFGLPLGFAPISTGLRLDVVSPNARTSDAMVGRPLEYQWLTWAIALGSEVASLGFSFERSYSNVAEVHGFGSWSVGANLRPLDHLALAGVIRQVDSPRSDGLTRLGTTYQFGAAFRPTGTDAVEVGAEAAYIDQSGGYWVPRAVVDVGIPGLGRLRGDVSYVDPSGNVLESSWLASTSLVIVGNGRNNSADLSLGTRFGSGINPTNQSRFYENLQVEVGVRGFRGTHAAESVHYALRVRLEDTPSTRQHVALLRRLWQMAEDERNLEAVVLELRAAPADSLAHLQELTDAIHYLRARGKKVLCHIEDGSGSSLYLCAAADKTLLNPAGSIRYLGLKSQSFYLQGLLEKIGVHADFVRIGPHKSAPEMFVRNEASEVALADKTDLLQQIELELVSGIARGRKLDPTAFRAATETAPFTASEAKSAGLVDGFAFDDMLEGKVQELSDLPLVLEEGGFGPAQPARFGPTKRIALVYLDGDMVDGRSQSFPFIGLKTAGSYTIAETLKQVREDDGVGAVVLRVETGGGSAMAAEVIWRELQLTAARKPVVVSMGTAAASGGYYVASTGSYVYANPLSITGSIGIFFGKIDVQELLGKIGVNSETLKTSRHADADDIFRPFTDEEREILKRKIETAYGLFLERVSAGRKLTREEVDNVGRGRVWTGRQAKERRLVDELGGLRQALAKARVLGGLRDDAPIVELPIPDSSLLGRLLGIEGLKEELRTPAFPVPPQLLDFVRAAAPLALYPSDVPLARIEFLPELTP